MSKVLRTALQNPTYESDFCAIAQLLDRSGIVSPGPGLLCLTAEGDSVFTLTTPYGIQHTHLIQEYAIHHLLYHFYGSEFQRAG